MQIKDIITEAGFWDKFKDAGGEFMDNFKTARTQRQAGAPMTPIRDIYNKLKNATGLGAAAAAAAEEKAQRLSANTLARKARETWAMQLSKYERDNNNQPLSQDNYEKLLSLFISKMSGMSIDPATVKQYVPDQNLTKVEKFISDVVLPMQYSLQQQQDAAQRQKELQNVGKTDPVSGIPYGTKIKQKVRPDPNSLHTVSREYTLTPQGYWVDNQAQPQQVSATSNAALYNKLVSKAHKKYNKNVVA